MSFLERCIVAVMTIVIVAAVICVGTAIAKPHGVEESESHAKYLGDGIWFREVPNGRLYWRGGGLAFAPAKETR